MNGGEKKGPVSPRSNVQRSFRDRLDPVLALSYRRSDEGRLAVTVDNKQIMFVSDLQARLALPPNGFDIAITGNVDHWGAISANGRLLSTHKDILEIKNLSLSGGRSSLSDLSGRLSWEKVPSLEISSGRSMLPAGPH
jgi:hypothetical protein